MKKKMSLKISLLIGAIAAICIALIFFASNIAVRRSLYSAAEDTLLTSIDAKTQIIDEFMSDREQIITVFSKSAEFHRLLKDPYNEFLRNYSQDYINDFYSGLEGWEGIYVDTWDAEVIAHSNPATVGLVMRTGDRLTQLQDALTEMGDKPLNLGIIKSPASGEIVVSLYCCVTENGKPIGFVGGATYTSCLQTILDNSTIEGMPNTKYSLIDVQNMTFIFDSLEDRIGTTVEDPEMLKVVEEVRNGNTIGHIEILDENNEASLAAYSYIENREWIMVIRDTTAEIYAGSAKSATVLAMICVIGFILIAGAAFLVVNFSIKPLGKTVQAIDSLKDLNLMKDENVLGLSKRSDEVGDISKAVISLTESLGDIVNTLDNCSQSLEESSKEMTSTSSQLLRGVEDNAATTEELSASIISTNEAIDAMTSEIKAMNGMVKDIDSSVKLSTDKSNALIVAAEQMSNKATDTLQDNKAKVDATKVQIDNALQNLRSLEKINEMTSQILEITSQTNLLALNASIEAARAGEAGRGFAVVASEIGKLAESSSRAVSEIQAICNESNKSIASVSDCFADIMSFLEEDVSMRFLDFADTSKKYELAVDEIKKAVDSISEISSRFVASMSSIEIQVNNVSEASTNNSQGIDDIIEKTNTTTENADSIIRVADKNKDNSNAIRDIISKFSK